MESMKKKAEIAFGDSSSSVPPPFKNSPPVMQNPSFRLAAPGRQIWAGSLYEIAHVHLPTITPVNLRSARVAMVTERTLLTVTIKYPSIKSLVEYFSSDISYVYSYPIPDEIFVMETDLADRVLLRYVPFKERVERKQFHAFWLLSNDGHCVVCDQRILGLRWDSRGLHNHSEPTNTNTTTDHSTSFEVAGVELITEKEGESREKDEEQNDDEDGEENEVDEGEKEVEKDEDDGENEEEDEEVVKKETNEAGVKRKRNKSAEKSLREMMKELKSKKKKGENEVEEDEDDGENEEAVKEEEVGESEEEDEEVVKKELKEEILELKNYAKQWKKKQSELEEEVRKLRSEMKEIKSKKKKGESQTIGVSSNPLEDQSLSQIASSSAFLILDPKEALEKNKVQRVNMVKELEKKLLSKLQSELQEGSKPNPLWTPYPRWV